MIRLVVRRHNEREAVGWARSINEFSGPALVEAGRQGSQVVRPMFFFFFFFSFSPSFFQASANVFLHFDFPQRPARGQYLKYSSL
jgi:hypothetical protein